MKWCVSPVLTVLSSFGVFCHAQENICRAGAICPYGFTCCCVSENHFHCCPLENAVCCAGSNHCCPEGYTCHVKEGVCKRDRKSMPQNEIGSANVIVCPGGEEQCPPGHSCCSVPGTDLFHCCPGGYSCEEGLCRETSAAMFSTSETKVVTGLLTGCGKK